MKRPVGKQVGILLFLLFLLLFYVYAHFKGM
ncbi:hypothetical protein Theam_1167 [Thermovibrio ammonificans HB-1]|uniref:Uncharacterized protein n=1 Tax=Thermovibrio ammonificans (strain DSM 15698 / JCM 12110 / HB-1) TaxID=648996 RepID=E8T2N6_THEA1|nr:hypothetical protein Theam_1167 [Thermovibrio ammonificans HB-1]